MAEPSAGYLSIPVTVTSASQGVFNEAGLDIDFRVESDTNEYGLYLDGTNGAVGIGTSTPYAESLHLYSGASGRTDFHADADNLIIESDTAVGLTLATSSSNIASIFFANESAQSPGKIQYDNQFSYMRMYSNWKEFLRATEAETVVNEVGYDKDFRVESDTNTHALFVQGSDGAVGINTSSPAAELHITDNSGAAAGATLIKLSLNAASTDGYSGLYLASRNGGTDYTPSIVTNYLGGITYESPSRHYLKCNAVEALSVGPSSVVINEPGNDVDFRVESDTNTHALFVQGSDGYVGINESAPSGVLHINNPSTPVTTSPSYSVNGDELILEGLNNVGMSILGGPVAGARIYFGSPTLPSDSYILYNNSAKQLSFFADTGTDTNAQLKIKQGIEIGSATGGFKGTGTINATAVYDDNTLLTDFVLDQAVDGEIDYEFYDSLELGGQAAREWDPRNLDIDWYSAQWRERRSLPAFMTKEERFDADGNEVRDSIGKLVQGLQQELETAHVHIAQLNERLKELEAKL